MGKLVFLDLAGTILDFNGEIPATAAAAIREARRNGHKVCLNTGRTYRQIDKKVLEIGFDGVISSSGSYVEYEGTCISHRYFTQLTYIELMKDLLEERCVVEIQTGKESYILRQQEEEYGEIVKRTLDGLEAEKRLKGDPVVVDSVLDVPEVEKLVVFSNELSREEILAKWGYSFSVTELSIPHTEKWAGAITPDYINKAEGMRQILALTDYRRKDTIAVGDGDNDLDMLRYAGAGAAMGNGSDSLKAEADYVTASVNEDGLRNAFRYFGLIEDSLI